MSYERRIKITHSIDDSYKHYKKSMGGKLDKKTYKAVAYDFNKLISEAIIKESFEYRIPYGLGFLRIKKRKLKFKLKDGKIDVTKNIIDWEETWNYWESIYPDKTRMEIKKIPGKKVFFQTNDHTNGEVMRWYWDKRFSTVKNVLLFSFKPVKGGEIDGHLIGKLGLSKWIKSIDKKNEYYF